MVSCRGIRLAVFDVDGVLVPVRSSWGFIHEMLGTSTESSRNYELAATGRISYWDWMYLDTLAWIEAHPGITRWDLDRLFSRVEPLPDAYRAVRMLRREGIEVALLSGGIDILVSKVAAKLGVKMWIANMLAFDAWGRLVPGGYAVVEANRKDRALRRLAASLGVPLVSVAYVGDSRWDARAMREACLAIAVNPADDEAAKAADYVVGSVVEAARVIVEVARASRAVK
jgi:phosphoserine phosphatase